MQWGRIWILGHNGKVEYFPNTSAKRLIWFLVEQIRRNFGDCKAGNLIFQITVPPRVGPSRINTGFRWKGTCRNSQALCGLFIWKRRFRRIYDSDAVDHRLYRTKLRHPESQYFKKYLQPCFLIDWLQFLDAPRIQNLTAYLEALHAKNLANSAHTSLLLNCYTKLKDTSRLDTFLKASALTTSEDNSPPFDLETAIRVTRQAGYFDHAVYLAKRYGQSEEYLRIQIEDREDWKEAAQYMRTMGSKAVRWMTHEQLLQTDI